MSHKVRVHADQHRPIRVSFSVVGGLDLKVVFGDLLKLKSLSCMARPQACRAAPTAWSAQKSPNLVTSLLLTE